MGTSGTGDSEVFVGTRGTGDRFGTSGTGDSEVVVVVVDCDREAEDDDAHLPEVGLGALRIPGEEAGDR